MHHSVSYLNPVRNSCNNTTLQCIQVLKVRQHPKKGFYADGLITIPVKDYADIERRIEQGTKNRTIASTNMNATSSRAHTIVGVTFIQKAKNMKGMLCASYASNI